MPLSAGQILNNRYRIVRLLGQGGFGAVYRAWDMNLDVPCAVKENLELSQSAQTQFRREASLLATLHHPNLPRVTDHFFIPNQGQYLVMDFIEGDDLKTMLEKAGGSLPEAQVLPWIGQVCEALTYLHSQQPPVIHRDIKPANIRITSKDQAVLVDFGIAKLYDPNLATTQGARAITPGYSPQEQYGQGRTDERSDVYALGATLYTLLTGETPVESVLRSSNPLPAPSSLNPAISPNVESAILKALQPSPAERFQSAAGFKAALEKPDAVHVTAPMADGPVVLAATVVSALTPEAVPIATPAAASEATSASAPASGAAVESAAPEHPRSSRRGTLAGAAALLLVLAILGIFAFLLIPRLARRTARIPGLGTSLALRRSATPRPSETPLPVAIAQGSPTRQPPPTPTPVLAPSVTPAAVATNTSYMLGKLAYVSRQNGYNQIYVMSPPGGSAIYLVLDAPQASGSVSPWWSPGGDFLAFTGVLKNGGVEVMLAGAAPNSQPKSLTPVLRGSSPTWSPDGKQVIFVGGKIDAGQFFIVDATTGKLVTQLDPGVANPVLPAWSPDGKQIAFATHDTNNQDIFLMPAGGGNLTRLTDNAGKNNAPAWSPDGKWIAFQSDRLRGGGHFEIWIMDPSGKNARQLTTTTQADWSVAPAWSPDGKWIAYVSGNFGANYGELYVIPVSGGDPLRLTDSGGNIFDFRPAWGK